MEIILFGTVLLWILLIIDVCTNIIISDARSSGLRSAVIGKKRFHSKVGLIINMSSDSILLKNRIFGGRSIF